MSNVEMKNKDNIKCKDTPILECLWWCEGCLEFFQKIKEDVEKKAIEKKNEIEVMINESGDIEKYPLEEFYKNSNFGKH